MTIVHIIFVICLELLKKTDANRADFLSDSCAIFYAINIQVKHHVTRDFR